MKAEALGYFHLPVLTMVGLMIFFIFFMSLLLWVYRKQGQPLYQQVACLPLGDEDV